LVELYVPLELPPTAARDATTEILRALGDREAPYERAMLSVGLREMRVPLDGTISVPIDAHVEARPLRWECALRIQAEDHQEFFPTFEGTITVTPNGRDACELWLQGNYVPPMGAMGASINASVLRGAAEASLRSFLRWLGEEVQRKVDEGERLTRFDRKMHP
jgi:hypothetical protein